jgi:hypothetical protein
MKIYPIIGSKYDGPPLDRPCLRKLPSGWVIEDPDPDSASFGGCIPWLIVAVVVIAVVVDLWYFWTWTP